MSNGPMETCLHQYACCPPALLSFGSSYEVCHCLFAFLLILTPLTLQGHSFFVSPQSHGLCEGSGSIGGPRCERNTSGEYTHSSSSVRFFSPILVLHSSIDASAQLPHPHTMYSHQLLHPMGPWSLSKPFPISYSLPLVHVIPHRCLGQSRPPPDPSYGLRTSTHDRLYVSMYSCESHSFILLISSDYPNSLFPGFPWPGALSGGGIPSVRRW
jgi:hypothetical protein